MLNSVNTVCRTRSVVDCFEAPDFRGILTWPWLLLLLLALPLPAAQPVLVISVDGLDQRYLANRDQLGLKIPHIRRMLQEGQWSSGVIGSVPTVTWPSHTTLITGVPPSQHGILGNRRPASEGGDYYWTADLIRVPTLLQAVKSAGLKTAAITWPVTVDAPVDFNLPEYFQRRRGGAMDLHSIESKATVGLVDRIRTRFPSFTQEWMDDRTRTQAVVYLLTAEKPDLLLVHLVDLDSEEHDNAPFSRESLAMLEYTDELIGQMFAALPQNYAVALVSDHGFERVNKDVNLRVLAAKQGITTLRSMGGIAVADDTAAAELLRRLSQDPQYGIGREIPNAEVARFAPALAKAAAVFEPAEGFWFGFAAQGEEFSKPRELGNHGHWPMRYRAVYALWGKGIAAERLPELPQTAIAERLASVLGVQFPSKR